MLNQAQIIGHLGRDPETRYLPSGEAVTTFSIATTERWRDKATGEMKEATEWHRCSAFGKLADICAQYLRKGSQAFVQGKITTKKYTDRSGNERLSTEIRVEMMKMLGARQASEVGHPASPRHQEPEPAHAAALDDLDSDIPF